jgi:hypothetical protein
VTHASGGHLALAVVVVAATLACRGSDSEIEIHVAGRPPVAVKDAELTAYLAWLREHMAAVNRHRAELEELSDRLSSKYSYAELHKITDDAELRAMVDRQQAAMHELEARSPLSGVKREAFEAAINGVAPREFHPDKMNYARRRDETALAAAAERYGRPFVDWVVARESQIIGILAP